MPWKNYLGSYARWAERIENYPEPKGRIGEDVSEINAR